MSRFLPSDYSSATYSLPGGASPYSFSTTSAPPVSDVPVVSPSDAAAEASKAKSDMFSSLAQSVGLLSAGIVAQVGAGQMQRSQQQHDADMVKSQGKLAALQTQASSAQASAQRAAAAVEAQGTKRTLFIVGGAIIGLTVIGGTVAYIMRNSSREEEEEE